jgi:hypothetical protein
LPGFDVSNEKRILLQGLRESVANVHRCEAPSIVSAGRSGEHGLEEIRETSAAHGKEVIVFTEAPKKLFPQALVCYELGDAFHKAANSTSGIHLDHVVCQPVRRID